MYGSLQGKTFWILIAEDNSEFGDKCPSQNVITYLEEVRAEWKTTLTKLRN